MTYVPQRLTAAEVRAAGIKAYDEKRLTAQHEHWGARMCVYEQEVGCNCVIGSALSPEAIAKIHELGLNDGSSVDELGEVIVVDSEDDQVALCDAQRRHDEWADAEYHVGNPSTPAEDLLKWKEKAGVRRIHFLQWLGHPEAA